MRAQTPDNLMFVGTHQGTGVIARMALVGGAATAEGSVTYVNPTTSVTSYTATRAGIYVDPPTNGMAQFKGLTTSADQKKYLQVICLGVAPVYATWAQSLSGTGTDVGFIVNCYTGIPQCAVSLVDGYTKLNTSHTDFTQTNNCMADPRYLTWRSFLLKT